MGDAAMRVPGPRGLPLGQDYYRLQWRTAAMPASAFEYFHSIREALARRDALRADGASADVYRSNRAAGLDELVP